MKIKTKKHLAALLSAFMLGSAMAPASLMATEATPKQEIIYTNLTSDGEPSETYVVNIFDLDKAATIIDYGNYTSVRNMTTQDKIDLKDQTVTINAGQGSLYYEGKLEDAKLPWTFDVEYTLDGTKKEASDLAGDDGALKMSLSIKNGPGDDVYFNNFALQVTMALDTDRCKNIKTEGATEAMVGSKKQLVYTIFPGDEKTIILTADVTDFEMDAIAINALPLSDDLATMAAQLKTAQAMQTALAAGNTAVLQSAQATATATTEEAVESVDAAKTTSFVSSKNKVTAVQFVIKTPAIQKEERITEKAPEKEKTFWEKLKTLFE